LSHASPFLAAPSNATQLTAWSVHPWAIPADGFTQAVITATVGLPPDEIASVSLDLTGLGGAANALLYDDGAHNDGAAGDGAFGLVTTAAITAQPGQKPLYLTIAEQDGQQTKHYLGTFLVLTPLDVVWPATLPSFLGWGTGEDTWQIETGLPWNYQARFITWDWQSWNPNYVRDFVQSGWEHNYVPVITVEMLLGGGSCNGMNDRECAYAHLQDATLMQGYFDRLSVAAGQAAGSQAVIFHIEPDISAYMQYYNDDPNEIPAWGGPGYANTFAGAVQHMVGIIQGQAPNALVGLHARSWATGFDVAGNVNPDLDIDGIAERTAQFLTAAGGSELDLIVADWKTVDAGTSQTWWDDTNQSLPHFNQVIYWQNRLAFHGALPLVLWRVPVGNMSLPEAYQDNRVDYAFAHARDLADAGIVAVVLGGGLGQSNPSTDGGNVEAKATIYYASPAMPGAFTVSVPGSPGLIEAAWSPNTEFDLWGYRLYYGRSAAAMTDTLDARRRTALQTVLPAGGQWFVSLVAYDARGVESQMAPAVSVTLDEPYHAYLPLLRR
jgi:hypothetical protein